MKRIIWKAVLRPAELQDIDVPAGSELLCAREQHGEVCVWFRCDPAAPKEKRTIAVIGTGHAAPVDGAYLGTASLHGGDLMFHIFAAPQISGKPAE